MVFKDSRNVINSFERKLAYYECMVDAKVPTFHVMKHDLSDCRAQIRLEMGYAFGTLIYR